VEKKSQSWLKLKMHMFFLPVWLIVFFSIFTSLLLEMDVIVHWLWRRFSVLKS